MDISTNQVEADTNQCCEYVLLQPWMSLNEFWNCGQKALDKERGALLVLANEDVICSSQSLVILDLANNMINGHIFRSSGYYFAQRVAPFLLIFLATYSGYRAVFTLRSTC